MREPSYIIDEHLRAGLRSDERIRRGQPACVELRNLKPSPEGAVSPEKLSYPITSPVYSQAWPFPQLRRGDRELYFYDGAELRLVNEANWSTSAVSLWQAADPSTTATLAGGGGTARLACFGLSFWITDGVNLIFNTPGNTGAKTLVFPTALIKCNAVHQFDNRLFLAGLSGTNMSSARWLDLYALWKDTTDDSTYTGSNEAMDTHYIVYSNEAGGDTQAPFEEIKAVLGFTSGDVDIDRDLDPILRDAIERGQIGIVPCRFTGPILSLNTLGSAMIAFGQRGVSLLTQTNDQCYEETPLGMRGIPGRGSVAGDDKELIAVDTDGDLWSFTSDRATRLGYKEFIGTLTLADIVVSFDPQHREWWISDGTSTYVYTASGLGGPMSLLPSSVVRSYASSTLLGTSPTINFNITVTPPTDLDHTGANIVLIRTTPVDLGQRGQKHITSFQVASSGVRDGRATVHYRYKQNIASYIRRNQDKVNEGGVARIDVNFLDAMIEVLGVAPTQDAEYDYIEVRYQRDDRRAIRGTTASRATRS